MRQVSYVQWLVLVLTQRAKEQVFPQVKDNFQSNVDLKIILAKENSKYVLYMYVNIPPTLTDKISLNLTLVDKKGTQRAW